MKINLVTLAVNVSRAYEVARAGGHTIKLVPGNENVRAADIDLFKDFYGIPYMGNSPDTHYDMVVEVMYSHQEVMLCIFHPTRFESKEDIDNRIRVYKQSGIKVKEELNTNGMTLLKSAVEKLSLSISDTLSVLKVAKTIAGLSQSETIQVEHLAEAIQYKSSDKQ